MRVPARACPFQARNDGVITFPQGPREANALAYHSGK